MNYWIGQFFGLLGLAVMVISLFQKDKDKMMFFVLFNGIFFGIEYLLLKAYSGMFSNFFGILRTYVCKEKENNLKLNKKIYEYLFLIGYLIIGFISFDGKVISLLPIIGELIYVSTLWQSSVKKIRIGTATMVILWLIYDVVILAIPSLICDIIVLTSSVTALLVKDYNLFKKEKEKKYV